MRVSCGLRRRAGVEGDADADATYFDGLATNLSRHEGLQNQYVVPACSALPPAALPGVTSIPQTGSFTVGRERVSAGCACPA